MNELITYLTSWQGIATSTVVSLLAWFAGHQIASMRRTGGLWPSLARFLAKPGIADWLIRRSIRTPYSHLVCNRDGTNRVVGHDYQLQQGETFYMRRFWLFNPYSRDDNVPVLRITLKLGKWKKTLAFPISIRVHHIMREDGDRDMHDHPWNARTVILKGHYLEKRMDHAAGLWSGPDELGRRAWKPKENLLLRRPGSTATLGFGEYHRICEVAPAGAWTLFISGPWKGVWGFWVVGIPDDMPKGAYNTGIKVPWREYLDIQE